MTMWAIISFSVHKWTIECIEDCKCIRRNWWPVRKIVIFDVRFDVLTAVKKSMLFWFVTPCGLVGRFTFESTFTFGLRKGATLLPLSLSLRSLPLSTLPIAWTISYPFPISWPCSEFHLESTLRLALKRAYSFSRPSPLRMTAPYWPRPSPPHSSTVVGQFPLAYPFF
jgi:hypothetical protein